MYTEFVACYEASGRVTWLKKFVPGLRVVDSIEKPLKLYCDNEPAVFYAHNNKSSDCGPKSGPKKRISFQTRKVIVAVNLTVIIVMMRHALYTDL